MCYFLNIHTDNLKKAELIPRLAINESKTKYLKINKSIKNLEQDMVKDGQVFEGIQNFRFLGT
jgi:hypothetical protein